MPPFQGVALTGSAVRPLSSAVRVRAAVALIAAALALGLLPVVPGTAQESPPSARTITNACIPGEVPASNFTDTDGTTHEQSIECVAWYQVAQGTGAGRFQPAAAVTRGQMASFIAAVVAHLGVQLPDNPPDAFADDNGTTHESNINALVALDMTSGYPDGTFKQARTVRRDQMASFIARALRGSGLDVPEGQRSFSDTTGNTHESNINAVAALGIAAGKGDGTYGVDEAVARGQMASFLARSVDLGVERGKAYEGGATVSLDAEDAKAGDTVTGRVASHRSIQTLNADGCGLREAVSVAADGTFSVTIPADQGDGTCTIAFTVDTLRVRGMTDVDKAFLQIGTTTTQAVVAITSPTSTSPATVEERRPVSITFTTDRAGGYALAHRREGASQFTLFDGQQASGSAEPGSKTVTLPAPGQDGRYDLELRFSTEDGKPSSHQENRALIVTDPPGPQPANVDITDPTSDSPEITTQGANVAVTFTTDKGGSYVLKYKPAFPPGGDAYLTFPDGGATGSMTNAGTKTVAVTAPATPGTYDLHLEFTTTAGQASSDTETGALIVSVPGITQAQRCDPLDPHVCMFPFPNDHFTAADPLSATGRRINFNVLSMPRNGADQDPSGANEPTNGAGKPIDPTEWNRNDGFSPGNHAMTYVPDLDLHQTWGTAAEEHAGHPNEEDTYYDYRDHIAEVERYLRPDAPIVIIDAETGERHPFWSELDMNTVGPGSVPVEPSRTLLLRPAVNWKEGHRYIVALRNLKDESGAVIEAGTAFKGYRDGTVPLTDARRVKYEEMFTKLAADGIKREELYLVWDFTVASERNLAERMLHIRDDAFGRLLGDTNLADGIVQGTAPTFAIDSFNDDGNEKDTSTQPGLGKYRTVKGRVTVPNYLDRPQEGYEIPLLRDPPDTDPIPYVNPAPPGSRFYYGTGAPGAVLNKDALPQQNPLRPTLQATFTCRIPLDRGPQRMALYGHGLLGTQNQVGDIRSPGNHGFGGCGLDWIGMATEDIPTVAATLADMSNFPTLPDRSQQGFLNFLYAGRAIVHPEGLVTHEAFQQNGQPLIRTATATETPLYYDGNSQGGILGAALMSVSVDAKRGILGVPGNNYSTLLNRSIDWEDLYAIPFYTTYQNKAEQQLLFAMIQMLWDRSEGNGYAQHTTTDPLANTIPHEVMWQVAWSDHQVSNHAAEVSARTTGSPVMSPNIERPPNNHHWERGWFTDPANLFSPTATYPYQGSALVYWDSGNTTPPNGNVPPTHNGDPHSHPRKEPAASWQEAHFLLTGEMVDVCQGQPYLTKYHPSNTEGDVRTPSCMVPPRAPGTTP